MNINFVAHTVNVRRELKNTLDWIHTENDSDRPKVRPFLGVWVWKDTERGDLENEPKNVIVMYEEFTPRAFVKCAKAEDGEFQVVNRDDNADRQNRDNCVEKVQTSSNGLTNFCI